MNRFSFRPYNYDIQAVMNLTSGSYQPQSSSVSPIVTTPPQQQAGFDQLIRYPIQPNLIPISERRKKFLRPPAQKSWLEDTAGYANSNRHPDFISMDKLFEDQGNTNVKIDRPIIFQYDPRDPRYEL